MDLYFRSLTILDAAFLAQMHHQIFPQQKWEKEDFTHFLGQDFYKGLLVYSNQDKDLIPLGYLIWQELSEEAEIVTIGILPEYISKKIGMSLYRKFEEQIAKRSVQKIFLEVAENNEIAVNFYRKMGFTFYNRRPNYYKVGHKYVDALLAVKVI